MSRTGIVISIGMGIAVTGIDESAHGLLGVLLFAAISGALLWLVILPS
jgi:hypothetical protein